jgi:group II intron reverse transcriptase/maturase
MAGTPSLITVSTRHQRLAELAQQAPQLGFTTLNHYLDLPWLLEAYRRTRKGGAAGVDGQTAADYEGNLLGNLQGLLGRAKSGTYRAPPVRRVHIPKGIGSDETRPLGIPTFEDKVLQRAVVLILEAIYEQDFYPGSYGFRPGRSAHQALRDLWQQTMQGGGGWILEVDIRKFFDTLDKSRLRDLLRRRVRDGMLLRLIDKWLDAGVLEEGSLSYPEAGTPQGGVISPLLANVYLHYVLDEWLEQEVKPRLRGRAFLIRYADDFVIGFTDGADARRVLEVLPKRFGKYGLTLHPEKTRLVPFQRPPQRPAGQDRPPKRPGTFTFLGFTHFWGKSRKGNNVVKQQTAASRLRRAIGKIADWCQRNRHRSLTEQHRELSRQLAGHYGYYGITGNANAVVEFYSRVSELWRRWLSRRSWASQLSWERFKRLLGRFTLPGPRVVHSVVLT